MVILNKKRMLLNTFIYAVLLIFIHSINFGSTFDNTNLKIDENVQDDVGLKDIKIKQLVNDNVDKNTKNGYLKESLDNNDFIGNLYISNEDFVSSIVQGKDNSFYLNHNINKEKSSFGSPFLDYRTKIGDKKLIIYGHNSRNIKMPFRIFENYYDKSYYKSHKYIYLDTVDGLRKYEVFSVYVETENFDYLDIDFPTKKSYYEHLMNFKNKSMYETDKEITGEEEMLIVQTCSTLKDYINYQKKFLLIISGRVN